MAIKEYRVTQADTRPIRRRPLSMVRDLVPSQKDSKAGDNAPLRTKDQPAITAQGRSPRYDAGSIMGMISSMRSPGEANVNYNPEQPVGGENVPYKPTTGIGGVLSRFFGNQANEMNVAAQEQQAAQMQDKALRDEERTAKREDLSNEINLRTEAERGLKKEDREFTASQNKASRDFQTAENSLDRILRSTEGGLDRNLRVSLATADRDAAANRLDKEFGFRTSESAADRSFRAGESKADRDARLAEGEANRSIDRERLAADARYKQQPQMISLRDGGLGVMNPTDGSISIVNPGTAAFGNTPGTPSTTKQVYPPVQFKSAGSGGGAQVDRTTGATLGGPLTTPTRSGISLGGALNEPAELPPGGGVRMGGRLPAPEAAVVTQPRSAETTPEEGYSIWTGRYPGQPEPVMGRLNFETTRKFLGPLGEDLSGAADRFAEPIPKRDLTNPEMNYNTEAYKKLLRRQMGSY